MVFTQIWYLHKQGLQDQNKGFTNYSMPNLPSNDEITRFDGIYFSIGGGGGGGGNSLFSAIKGMGAQT